MNLFYKKEFDKGLENKKFKLSALIKSRDNFYVIQTYEFNDEESDTWEVCFPFQFFIDVDILCYKNVGGGFDYMLGES